jgi:hypothetical protein
VWWQVPRTDGKGAHGVGGAKRRVKYVAINVVHKVPMCRTRVGCGMDRGRRGGLNGGRDNLARARPPLGWSRWNQGES